MESPIRAILIDDEQDSLIALEEQIKMYCPSVKIIGKYDDPHEGLEAIQTLNPNLVFLDIDMPRMTGLDLANRIKSDEVYIIFVTAHNQYAINAIKLSALDYLLKPTGPDELKVAVKKAEKLVLNKKIKDPDRIKTFDKLFSNIQNQEFSQETKIPLPETKGIFYVKIKDIIRLEAEKNYCYFHFTDGTKMIVSKNIGYYKDILENYNLVQVHRSHIANLEHRERYIRVDGHYLIMSDGSEVPVSKNFRDKL